MCIKCIVETLGFRQSNGHFVFLGETDENKLLDRENLKFANHKFGSGSRVPSLKFMSFSEKFLE